MEVGGIRADARTVAFLASHRAFGLAYADGRRLWSSPEPPHCGLATVPDMTTATGGVLVAAEQCLNGRRPTRYVLGMDARSGRRLWRFDLQRWSDSGGDFELLKMKPYADGQVILYGLWEHPSLVLTAATGRLLRRGPGFGAGTAGPAEGVLVTKCGAPPRSEGWCGYDYSDGRLLWRRVAPVQRPTVGVAIDGARVYAVSGTTSRGYTLAVTGLHDGRHLGDFRLPQLRFSDGRPFVPDDPRLKAVKDGVIVIDDGAYSLYADPGRP